MSMINNNFNLNHFRTPPFSKHILSSIHWSTVIMRSICVADDLICSARADHYITYIDCGAAWSVVSPTAIFIITAVKMLCTYEARENKKKLFQLNSGHRSKYSNIVHPSWPNGDHEITVKSCSGTFGARLSFHLRNALEYNTRMCRDWICSSKNKMSIIFCLVEKLIYDRSAIRVLSRNNRHSNIIAKPMTECVLVVITLGLFTHKCHLPLIGIAS